jgi:hypothetical protein
MLQPGYDSWNTAFNYKSVHPEAAVKEDSRLGKLKGGAKPADN